MAYRELNLSITQLKEPADYFSAKSDELRNLIDHTVFGMQKDDILFEIERLREETWPTHESIIIIENQINRFLHS